MNSEEKASKMGRDKMLGRIVLALFSAAVLIFAPADLRAQSVSDRALSDVDAEFVGDCATLTINFNIRIQLIGYFPSESGRELHVRVRPLDPGVSSLLRESLRPPSSVQEIRSIDFEGDNPSGPVLSLFFSRDMRFEVAPGRDPRSLIIRLGQPGSGPLCDPQATTMASSADASQQSNATSQPVDIPAGLYVVNLASRSDAEVQLNAQQQAAIGQGVLYETLSDRDARILHRLRLGFFTSRSDAEAERQRLSELFPEAFVISVSAAERAQGVANRISAPAVQSVGGQQRVEASSEEAARVAELVGQAESAFAEQSFDRAIQLLTNALQLPEASATPRAQELIGVLRERKGQEAQATAEYQEYLRRYPTGEAADRVRQRLAALGGDAGSGLTLRRASGSAAGEWNWGVRGSFSQFYFRDQSKTRFVDASRPEIDPDVDNSVNLNQLLTAGDVTISGGDDRRQIELRASGSYTANFRNGGDDIQSITALYLEYSDEPMGAQLRVGRQTRNSSGVLGRFDGGLLGVDIGDKVRLNGVAGFPVLRSRQTFILNERPFYGASIDVGGRRSPFRGTVYWFDQRSKGGFVDRQSVGFETRVLLPRFNAFTIVDYDVHFNELNLGLATLNYIFADNSNLSATFDYRQSPLLTTTNALTGQVFSDTFLPVPDLQGLRPFFTDDEIYQLASDRTFVTKSATISYSRPIDQHLQANLDFTITDTGGTPGTPASAGTFEILPIAAVGTEYYYGAQLIGTGLFWSNDIYILSGRYSDTQRSNTYTADFNARIPVTRQFRVSPRLRYGQRQNKLTDSTFRQLQPRMRINYFPMRDIELELEVGADFAHQRDALAGVVTTTDETGFLVSAGYRIDF